MDKNLNALMHVQNALLAALASTHPDPARLNQAFSWHLEKLEETLSANEPLMVHVNVWAKTFRQHIPATHPESNSTA